MTYPCRLVRRRFSCRPFCQRTEGAISGRILRAPQVGSVTSTTWIRWDLHRHQPDLHASRFPDHEAIRRTNCGGAWTRQSGNVGWRRFGRRPRSEHAGPVPGTNFVGRQQSCVPGSAPIALRVRENTCHRSHRASGNARKLNLFHRAPGSTCSAGVPPAMEPNRNGPRPSPTRRRRYKARNRN